MQRAGDRDTWSYFDSQLPRCSEWAPSESVIPVGHRNHKENCDLAAGFRIQEAPPPEASDPGKKVAPKRPSPQGLLRTMSRKILVGRPDRRQSDPRFLRPAAQRTGPELNLPRAEKVHVRVGILVALAQMINKRIRPTHMFDVGQLNNRVSSIAQKTWKEGPALCPSIVGGLEIRRIRIHFQVKHRFHGFPTPSPPPEFGIRPPPPLPNRIR